LAPTPLQADHIAMVWFSSGDAMSAQSVGNRSGSVASHDARICSFECTFCRDCAETTLPRALPELWW
jgi:Protein of unknown function (DUF1272)